MKTNVSLSVAAALLVTGLAVAPSAQAAIAQVTKFTGEVIIQSGDVLKEIKAPGVALNDGDRIQTKKGDAEIRFNDGAIMKVSPFSNAMVQELKESSGFWIFQTKVDTRRITCLVGKLFFRSGTPGKKNYLQTATAVAGIRGSAGDIGFDNINTYLHMYEGEAAVVGNALRGLFHNPGVTAAQRSVVYQALDRAYNQTRQAATTGRESDLAQAGVTVAAIGRQVAQILQQNPDPAVKANAAVLAQTAETVIASAQAKVSVAKIKEEEVAVNKALADARQKADSETARQAELAAQKLAENRAAAEQAATEAKAAVAQAAAAQAANDLAAAARAAQAAKDAAQKAAAQQQQSQQDVKNILTTTVETTAPAEKTETTGAPTTVVDDKDKKDKKEEPATTVTETTVVGDKEKKDSATTVTETTVKGDTDQKQPATTVETTGAPTTVDDKKDKRDKKEETSVPTTVATTIKGDKGDKGDKKKDTTVATTVATTAPTTTSTSTSTTTSSTSTSTTTSITPSP